MNKTDTFKQLEFQHFSHCGKLKQQEITCQSSQNDFQQEGNKQTKW